MHLRVRLELQAWRRTCQKLKSVRGRFDRAFFLFQGPSPGPDHVQLGMPGSLGV